MKMAETKYGSHFFIYKFQSIDFSQLSTVMYETKKHLLCGWETNSYTKISPFRYNEVVQAIIKKRGKVIITWLIKQIY